MKITRRQLQRLIFENLGLGNKEVFAHVTANTGCGKTTLMFQLQDEFPQYIFFDLDEFGDRASKLLGWPKNWGNTSWTEEKNEQWQEVQQQLANEFIETASKPVVFFGIHHNTYHGKAIPFFTFNIRHKILLDIDPEICAERKFSRDYPKMKVMPDGSLSGGGTMMKFNWMYPGMDKNDPEIIAKVMKELEKSVHTFNNEVTDMGYEMRTEDNIRKILMSGHKLNA